MSLLRLYPDENDPTRFEDHRDFDDIVRVAERIGFRFERWQASQPLSPGAGQEEVLTAYRASVERLQRERGFVTVDVIGVGPQTPDPQALRAKFLEEHIHSEDEARFFVDGCGVFYIHVGGQVVVLLCERGDLVNVPAGTTHWFDMGAKPRFSCIRLFNNPSGWVAQFTGSPIASRFPRFETVLEARG
jgi:1,2-dihydroxy-3-keto-5-methylthiopentene dioxygenase